MRGSRVTSPSVRWTATRDGGGRRAVVVDPRVRSQLPSFFWASAPSPQLKAERHRKTPPFGPLASHALGSRCGW